MRESERIVKDLLAKADITINGKRAWDIQVDDSRCYERFIQNQSVGFGESYMDGMWDAKELDETIARIIQGKVFRNIQSNTKLLLYRLHNKITTFSTNSRTLPAEHFPGNDLYESMLDPDMNYSCGYWKTLGNIAISWKIPRNLIKSQEAKLSLVCKKLYLRKGQKVLDIGCGWGSFAKYAASKFGVQVVGITRSKEQAHIARQKCKGLPVKILIQDYQDLGKEQYDKVVAIEKLEQVPQKDYDAFMQTVSSHLKDNGLFLLHTLGSTQSRHTNDIWNGKYMFPHAHIPSLTQICHAVENIFTIEDVHNFGLYYYPTFMSWFRNFNKNWKKIAVTNFEKYNERFYRMWKYYLLSSAGISKARSYHVWQIVLSKNTFDIYNPVR